MLTRNNLNFGVIILLFCLSGISIELYLASRPIFSGLDSASHGAMQLILISLLVGISLSQFIFPPLAEYGGRRLILLISLAGYCVFSLLSFFPIPNSLLNLSRFLQVLTATGCGVLALSFLSDQETSRDLGKKVAILGGILGFAVAVLPFVGGYVNEWYGWRVSFLGLFFLGVLGFLGVLLLLKESTPAKLSPAPTMNIWNGYFKQLNDYTLRHYLLATACGFTAYFIVIAYSPFIFLNDLIVNKHVYAIMLIFLGFAYTTGSGIAYWYSQELEADKIAILGSSLLFMSSILIVAFYGFMHDEILIFVPLAIASAGVALINSAGTSLILARSTLSAHAAALTYAVKYLLAPILGFFIIFILHAEMLTIAGLMAALNIAAIILFWRVRPLSS
ncbi:MAG: MFS transporter [Legionellales bacterium]|nr:MFS transporter [Legionellales bacterium]